MHSGGQLKQTPYQYIYIELPESQAIDAFQDRFNHDPNAVACPCCGENYAISEADTLAQASGYQRDCKFDGEADQYVEEQAEKFSFNEYEPLDSYVEHRDVLVLREADLVDPRRN
jgi:hypothetical protein